MLVQIWVWWHRTGWRARQPSSEAPPPVKLGVALFLLVQILTLVEQMFNLGLIFKDFNSYFVTNIIKPSLANMNWTQPGPCQRECVWAGMLLMHPGVVPINLENYKPTVRFTPDTQTCPRIHAKLKIWANSCSVCVRVCIDGGLYIGDIPQPCV